MKKMVDGKLVDMTSEEIAQHVAATSPTVASEKARLLSAISQKRWEVETGGLTLPNGFKVKTGVSDQNRISSVVAIYALGGMTDDTQVDFKAEDGWAGITIGDVKNIAGAIARHVQACFTAQRVHEQAVQRLVDAKDLNRLRTYDINTGWPA